MQKFAKPIFVLLLLIAGPMMVTGAPGDTTSEAISVSTGTTNGILENDTDSIYYQFDPSTSGYYELSLSAGSSTDFDFDVLDEDEFVIGGSYGISYPDSTVVYVDTLIYIYVYSYSGSGGFNLTITESDESTTTSYTTYETTNTTTADTEDATLKFSEALSEGDNYDWNVDLEETYNGSTETDSGTINGEINQDAPEITTQLAEYNGNYYTTDWEGDNTDTSDFSFSSEGLNEDNAPNSDDYGQLYFILLFVLPVEVTVGGETLEGQDAAEIGIIDGLGSEENAQFTESDGQYIYESEESYSYSDSTSTYTLRLVYDIASGLLMEYDMDQSTSQNGEVISGFSVSIVANFDAPGEGLLGGIDVPLSNAFILGLFFVGFAVYRRRRSIL